MKKIFELSLLAMSMLFLCGKSYSQCVPVDTVALKQSLARLHQSNFSPTDERAFFDAFPKTWDEFYLTYGWLPPYESNMQKYYLDHLSAFGKLSSIPKEEYCDRLISLCWCGHWRADAVSFLQRILREYTMKNLTLMLSRLEHLESGKQFYFWLFYFQNTSGSEDLLKEYNRIRAEIKNYKKLSGTDLNLAFVVGYGKTPFDFGGGYPSYDGKSR